MKEIYEKLLLKAKRASENAYAPYSNYHVGACVLFESGNEYTGCNVENSSYGLSICAERNAISTAIANGEKGKIRVIAIDCDDDKHIFMPCGACRQWLVGFGTTPDFKAVLYDKKGGIIEFSIDELLPNNFYL